MTKFLSKMSASVLLTMVFIVGGLLLSAGEAKAQSSLFSTNPTVKPASGWVSTQTAVNLVNQQIATLDAQLLSPNPTGAAVKKMTHLYYEVIAGRLESGNSTEEAVQEGYHDLLANNPVDNPGTVVTAQQMHTIYLGVVDLLSN